MLRVFKWRSAMSMGSSTLSAFDGAAFVTVAANEAIRYGSHLPLLPQIARLGDFGGTITGLLLAGYTDVLIGATAIPVWHEHRHLLPAHFLTSGLGGSAAMLELLGFLLPVTLFIGFAAAGAEIFVGAILEARPSRVDAPLHHGKSGRMMRIAGAQEGPIALLVRIFWPVRRTNTTLRQSVSYMAHAPAGMRGSRPAARRRTIRKRSSKNSTRG